MIDSMDIYRCIREVLESNFSIKVQDKDRKNPQPPCFFIQVTGDNDSQTALDFETTNYSYSIVYFSNKESLLDLSLVKEDLKRLFKKPLKVTAYGDSDDINYLEVTDLDTYMNEDDYILTVTINIEHVQPLGIDRFETNNEVMDDMDMNLKMNT